MSTTRRRSDLMYFTELGSGPPLVLVHGLMVTGEMYEGVLPRFASRHRVIVPDLRGHGRSRDMGPPYTVAQLATDIASLLVHLEVGSAAILGYSEGGAVAQQLVLDHPALCRQLVLACTFAHNMATAKEKLEGQVTPLLIRLLGMRRFAKLVVSQGEKGLSKERGDWLAEVIAHQDRAVMSSAWKDSLEFDSRLRLREIRCPTLIVAGAEDDAVPVHHAQTLHEGIARSQLVVVDGASHALIWTHGEPLVQSVEDFLGRSILEDTP